MKEMRTMREICIHKQEELIQLQKKVEKALSRAPEGSLILSSSNGSVQYYRKTQETTKRGKYIEKKNQKLIKALAQKEYNLSFLKEIGRQKKQMDRLLKNLTGLELEEMQEEVFSKMPLQRQELVRPHILSDAQYIEQWLQEEYSGKEFQDSNPVFETERGEWVRSKSEKMLADKLFSMGIPYRYEYPLRMKGFGTIYPDFTILKVSTREELYLEHLGMMDNPQYSQKAIMKLQTYAKNNIYPGKNLLLTFETLQTPIDMKLVEEMLKEFVL